jgi:hypothetical protein
LVAESAAGGTVQAMSSPENPEPVPGSRRNRWIVAAAAGLLILLSLAAMAAAVFLHHNSTAKTAATPTASAAPHVVTAADRARWEKRGKVRGYTSTVTVAQYRGAIAAMPKPAKLPPMIAATGQCAVALNEARDFFDEVPTGLTLTAAQDTELNSLLAAVRPGPKAACSPTVSQMFLSQEFEPWAHYEGPPVTASVPSTYKTPDIKDAKPAPLPTVAHPKKSVPAHR